MSGVSDYDTTASNNTPAGTESIRSGDDQIRQMKADIASYTRVGADLASASTLNLDSVDSLELAVTGTTTVTAVTLTEGHVRTVRATGVFQITASASLIVNGSTSINYTTTAGDLLKFVGYGSSVVRVWVIGAGPASQSEQESATATSKYVSPAVQQFHPSAAKGWAKFDSDGNNLASYNVTSITDNGTGDFRVTWNVDFSSNQYCAVTSCEISSSGYYTNIKAATNAGLTDIRCWNPTIGLVDASNYFVVGYGDQ